LRSETHRYRVMVLTSWDRRMSDCEWIIACNTNDKFVTADPITDENVIEHWQRRLNQAF